MMASVAAISGFDAWLDRSERRSDTIAAAPLAALSATLDRDDPLPGIGDAVPPLWHWLYFLPTHRQSELGADGHAQRGGFLPPVPLPRRMWAGGRLRFERALRVGEAATRTSRIASIVEKAARSGPLVFVTVQHEIHDASGRVVSEDQDIVYRAAPALGTAARPTAAPSDEAFSRRVVPDDVLLFRYSALTFNGHRIHYDRRYVTEVEGYPGLVVHGPLIATLLLDLLRRERPEADIRGFDFRAVSPLFDLHPFTLCGRPDGERRFALWARDRDGALAMQASAEIA
jgi:3-methylfumaryl-CoA hydratase